jgi:RNA recognition motif. (a.k.a. RRM, RBD, or RNP domain)
MDAPPRERNALDGNLRGSGITLSVEFGVAD